MLDPQDLLSTVKEDIAYIRDEFRKNITDAELRRASSTLRRLLVDGELQRAWKAAGLEKQPAINAIDLEPTLVGLERDRLFFAGAGGAQFNGCIVAETIFAKQKPPSGRLEGGGQPSLTLRDFSLSEFSRSTSVVVFGKTVSRHQIIKYIANKLGGSHHDARRGNTNEDIVFASLDRLSEDQRLHILGKPAVYFELLGIGQAMAKSPDLQRLLGVI